PKTYRKVDTKGSGIISPIAAINKAYTTTNILIFLDNIKSFFIRLNILSLPYRSLFLYSLIDRNREIIYIAIGTYIMPLSLKNSILLTIDLSPNDPKLAMPIKKVTNTIT